MEKSLTHIILLSATKRSKVSKSTPLKINFTEYHLIKYNAFDHFAEVGKTVKPIEFNGF